MSATGPNTRTLLELKEVHTSYGVIEALKGISLEVREGEIVTIIGANGAGKTTTLMTISGVNRVRSGTITFAGQRIDGRPAHEIVRLGISQVPEGRKIFPRLTVRENLEMGAFTRDDVAGIAEDLEKNFALFPILKERQSQVGGTLSGGEQQMLAIARALMTRPKLLLMDEPSLGLAPLIIQRIFEVIATLNKAGTTILLVEQNAMMALGAAHRAYVMETGRITMEDVAARLKENEAVKKAYLGA